MISKTLSFIFTVAMLVCVVRGFTHKSDTQLKQDYNLKPDELDAFKRSFLVYDRNHDNHITEDELVSTLKELKVTVSGDHVKALRAGDGNGDNFIDLDEFIFMVQKDPDVDFLFKKVFQLIDVDKNGSLTAEELHTWFTKTLGRKVSVTDIEKDIQSADGDQDGKISYLEMLTVLKSELSKPK